MYTSSNSIRFTCVSEVMKGTSCQFSNGGFPVPSDASLHLVFEFSELCILFLNVSQTEDQVQFVFCVSP